MQADVVETLDAFRDGLREVLCDEHVAAYVFGSAVTGDLAAASSDVDFVVVAERRLDASSGRRHARTRFASSRRDSAACRPP